MALDPCEGCTDQDPTTEDLRPASDSDVSSTAVSRTAATTCLTFCLTFHTSQQRHTGSRKKRKQLRSVCSLASWTGESGAAFRIGRAAYVAWHHRWLANPPGWKLGGGALVLAAFNSFQLSKQRDLVRFICTKKSKRRKGHIDILRRGFVTFLRSSGAKRFLA